MTNFEALCWFISSIIKLWFLESDVWWTSVKTKHCCWHLFCQGLNTYDEFYELKPPKSKSQLLILIFFSNIFSNDYTKIVNFSSYFLFHWLIEESHFVKKIHDPKHWIFKCFQGPLASELRVFTCFQGLQGSKPRVFISPWGP